MFTDTGLQSMKRTTGSSVREGNCCFWCQDREGKRPEKPAGQDNCSAFTSDSQDDMQQDLVLLNCLVCKTQIILTYLTAPGFTGGGEAFGVSKQRGFICA